MPLPKPYYCLYYEDQNLEHMPSQMSTHTYFLNNHIYFKHELFVIPHSTIPSAVGHVEWGTLDLVCVSESKDVNLHESLHFEF